MRLPGFLVIGAQKAGSTWFTRNLRSHPQIYMPLEEIRFFTKNYAKGPQWYSDQFARAPEGALIGEGTPGYILRKDAPARIADTLGRDVKLILSLRNPVDRAYSSYWNLLSGGVLPANTAFETAFNANTNEMRSRGLYSEQLLRYLKIFPKRNLQVSVVEYDLGDQGPRMLSDTFRFLGVDDSFQPPVATKPANAASDAKIGGGTFGALGRAVAQRSDRLPAGIEEQLRRAYLKARTLLPTSRPLEPLDEQLRAKCFDVYSDDVAQLENLLNRELDLWRP